MFCQKCGSEFGPNDSVCPNCGALPPGKKFCQHCGKVIDEECVVCPNCGKQVKELKREEPQQQQQPNIVINNSNNNVNRNSNVNRVGGYGGYGSPKNKWVAFFLCLFLGYFGVHKFYEGKILLGVVYLFTMGLFFIGVLIDLISLLFKPNPYFV